MSGLKAQQIFLEILRTMGRNKTGPNQSKVGYRYQQNILGLLNDLAGVGLDCLLTKEYPSQVARKGIDIIIHSVIMHLV